MHRRSTTLPARARLLLALALALALECGRRRIRERRFSARVDDLHHGFGPNVIIFDPSMPVSEIQATVDAIHTSRSTPRWARTAAFLFKPGVYGTATEPLQMKVSYYTEVAGLGASH